MMITIIAIVTIIVPEFCVGSGDFAISQIRLHHEVPSSRTYLEGLGFGGTSKYVERLTMGIAEVVIWIEGLINLLRESPWWWKTIFTERGGELFDISMQGSVNTKTLNPRKQNGSWACVGDLIHSVLNSVAAPALLNIMYRLAFRV